MSDFCSPFFRVLRAKTEKHLTFLHHQDYCTVLSVSLES